MDILRVNDLSHIIPGKIKLYDGNTCIYSCEMGLPIDSYPFFMDMAVEYITNKDGYTIVLVSDFPMAGNEF